MIELMQLSNKSLVLWLTTTMATMGRGFIYSEEGISIREPCQFHLKQEWPANVETYRGRASNRWTSVIGVDFRSESI